MITPKKQLFDLTYLKKIDDQGLIDDLINLYLMETQSGLLQMKKAFDKPDYEAIHTIVDQLKITTGMIQASAFYSVLEEIEKISKYGGEYYQLLEQEHFAQYEFKQLKYELELYLKC